MTYLLDTNACIRVIAGTSHLVAVRLARTRPSDVCVAAITRAELVFGAWRSSRSRANLAAIDAFLEPYECIPFDRAAADLYGRIRAGLASRGRPIGPNDLLIASIAVAGGFTVVTHNTREFTRVPGLHAEDWET